MPNRFALPVAIIAIAPVFASESDAETTELSHWLVIGGVGKYGRTPVHTDAIEAQLVTGDWKPPQAMEVVKSPDGVDRIWTKATTGEDGWLTHQALGPGYACSIIRSEKPRTVLLEASGHSIVYVNGQPRGGDVYGTGWVRHPIELKTGENSFLFLCRRGRVRARLISTDRPFIFNKDDTTLPDLLRGEPSTYWAAIPIINATDTTVRDQTVVAILLNGGITRTRVPNIPPMTTRKVGFRIEGTSLTQEENVSLDVRLLSKDEDLMDTVQLKLRVRDSNQKHKRTFVSDIDGSIQYFAVTPMHDSDKVSSVKPALVLTLHGAGVEAAGQANAYMSKDWAHIVAPTNRRPFGFDWEDWGRWDALEVLGIAEAQFGTDPRRTYLTGHSMGGHGTWQLGSLFPDRFAAIAPSAGWISFRSYSSKSTSAGEGSAIEEILRRAASTSDTLSRSNNLSANGIYILHGDQDDNVPITEARTMRAHLANFHADFAYYERPGAGHWWGNDCVDWPPLFEFFQRRDTPRQRDIGQLKFATSNPSASATCHWATIAAQIEPLALSTIDLTFDRQAGRLEGTTQNVRRLVLDQSKLSTHRENDSSEGTGRSSSELLTVSIDKTEVTDIPRPDVSSMIHLQKEGVDWRVSEKPPAATKGPHRSGPFKEAFKQRFVLVYGTAGTSEENAWSYGKARFDAETFWYRGNGSVDVWSDKEFLATGEPDRSVILYGHAESNSAWGALLSESPVQVARGSIMIGTRAIKEDGLGCLFIQPRPGSDVALVAAVSGSDAKGMRLTTALPYFTSGVAYPDCVVLSNNVLMQGLSEVKVAGFFGEDWDVQSGDFSWTSNSK